MKGFLISFEGIDGSGKTTQLELLSKRLRDMGHAVLTLREPGGSPIGEEIRYLLKHSPSNAAMTPEAELLLMNASRAQLVTEMINPALDNGKVVLCDRFYDSTTAYQTHGRRLNPDLVNTIVHFAIGHIHPHLTIFLQIPFQVSILRRSMRDSNLVPDRMERVDRAFSERVIKGYELIAAEDPLRFRTVDGTRSVQAVHDSVWGLVIALFGSRSLTHSPDRKP